MAELKQKFFGSLSLDEIGKAVKGAPSKYQEHEQYGKQLKVTAAQWEDGGITVQVYDSETKIAFKIGSLRVSTPFESKKVEEVKTDLPF